MPSTAPFRYNLPAERIAQRPIEPPDGAKLLVVRRSDGALIESVFSDLPGFVSPRDLFVVNETRVIPARIFGEFESGGAVEVLLVRSEDNGRKWRCTGNPLRRFRPGTLIKVRPDLSVRVLGRDGEREALVEIAEGSPEALFEAGSMPIPPYIRNARSDDRDRSDYQSIFARSEGSIAAPTASLHFTPALVSALEARGCGFERVTLHLGTGSFLPIEQSPGAELSPPGAERFECPRRVLDACSSARESGGKVTAIGTSVVRALETAARSENPRGETSLFITPGFDFRRTDAMITNFHQPGSSHLLLVQAFMGEELLRASYAFALDRGFRFLSYGDGMLIV